LAHEESQSELEQTNLTNNRKHRETERRRRDRTAVVRKAEQFPEGFRCFSSIITTDATELGLMQIGLVSLSITKMNPKNTEHRPHRSSLTLERMLDGPGSDGLQKRLTDATDKIADIRGKLDAPNRNYQGICNDSRVDTEAPGH